VSTDTLPVRSTAHGAVTVLAMDLPAKRNALVPPLRDALIEAMEAALADDACRAIVLTGSAGSFCAGGDLDGLRDHDPLYVRARMQRGQHLIRLLASGAKPVVAAVNGGAYGAGLSIACACDWIVAGGDAKFAASFMKVGLMPDFGLLWSLPRRIGMAQARRLMYAAQVLDATEALHLGLAEEVVPAASLLEHAIALADRFTGAPPVAMTMLRAALARDIGTLDDALAQELEGQTLLFSTEDFTEGVRAFRERRPTRFVGR
jgi:enoyl-CoA hydratase/carnithine racemase